MRRFPLALLRPSREPAVLGRVLGLALRCGLRGDSLGPGWNDPHSGNDER